MSRNPGPPARSWWWQPWAALAGFAFLVHFVWEMLQFPLYRGMADVSHDQAVRVCLLATFGDVAITLAALAVAATVGGGAGPAMGFHTVAGRVYLVVALAVGLAIEYASLFVWERWSYQAGVPRLLGVGTHVLAQWLLLPPLILWLARRHLAGGRSQSIHS